jgi:ankyrin repeat protein
MSKFDDILTAIYQRDAKALEGLSAVDLNGTDDDGRTPLMHAVLAEHADPLVVRTLIQHGAQVDTADRDQKWTALHFAARDQKEQIVKTLLDAGATVDPVDVFGNTPLWRAVMNVTSDLGTIKELVKRSADPNKKNDHSIAPIDIARTSGREDVLKVLGAEA